MQNDNKNIFDKMDEWVNGTEGSIVNFLTAFSPWMAPLAPAYMTFRHMDEFLHFPYLISIALAALVEILGFATVSTGLDFYFHNKKEKSGVKRAPIEVVVGVFIFYLGLILVSNVVIDISVAYLDKNWQSGAIILVRALLTLQTVPGALIVAVRTGHRDLLRQIKREKEEADSRKLSESDGKSRGESGDFSENFPKRWSELRKTLTWEQVVWWSQIDSVEVKKKAKLHNVDERSIVNWRSYARQEVEKAGKNEANV